MALRASTMRRASFMVARLQAAKRVARAPGHLLRRANAFDDGTHLHGDGAQSEEIRLFVGFGAIALCRELSDPMSHSDYGLCQTSKSRIAGEMMPSTHEAVKGWLTGDTRNRVRG